MEKYGFIYLWYDKKYKKYYVGRHWGHEDDGYICSSNLMRTNYSRRKKDFRRRIISKIFTCQEDLVLEEQRWLDMIKPEECKIRYYNISLNAKTPSHRGRKHTEETKEKMRNAALGRKVCKEAKEKIRNTLTGRKLSEEHRKNISKNSNRNYNDKNFKKNMSKAACNRSPQHQEKLNSSMRKARIGTKLMINDKGIKKFAKPNTELCLKLLDAGYSFAR